KGLNGDSAYTFGVGQKSAEDQALLDATKASLYKGIEQAVAGARVGDIGYAIQSYTEALGYSVVRELVGHGIGHHLHESPEVPNYGRRGHGVKLTENMVICIEPMINQGVKDVYLDDNGWAVYTADHKKSAHFELTVAVKKGAADVLSTFAFIENNK
ncbi:MAG: M24 family metallopeptidase, partial [Bacteroidales bacterium]|nr:M24 family metallopeptidase [Bacteroidales bacterium]